MASKTFLQVVGVQRAADPDFELHRMPRTAPKEELVQTPRIADLLGDIGQGCLS